MTSHDITHMHYDITWCPITGGRVLRMVAAHYTVIILQWLERETMAQWLAWSNTSECGMLWCNCQVFQFPDWVSHSLSILCYLCKEWRMGDQTDQSNSPYKLTLWWNISNLGNNLPLIGQFYFLFYVCTWKKLPEMNEPKALNIYIVLGQHCWLVSLHRQAGLPSASRGWCTGQHVQWVGGVKGVEREGGLCTYVCMCM